MRRESGLFLNEVWYKEEIVVVSEQVTSGADVKASGQDVEDQSKDSSGAESNKHYEKLLREKKNTMERLREVESKLQEKENEDLMRQKQFEVVIDNLKKENTQIKDALSTERETIKRAKLTTSLLGEVKKLGFVDSEANKEALVKLADLKSVEIDPTTNTVIGVEEAAKGFYDKYASLGFFQKQSPKTNFQAPQVNFKDPQIDITKLSKDDRLKYFSSLAGK